MTKAGTKRAASRPQTRININTDRQWFTKRLMNAFYHHCAPKLRQILRDIAKKEGVPLAELFRKNADKMAKIEFRKHGCLRKSQRQARRGGISIGHLFYGVCFPDRSLN